MSVLLPAFVVAVLLLLLIIFRGRTARVDRDERPTDRALAEGQGPKGLRAGNRSIHASLFEYGGKREKPFGDRGGQIFAVVDVETTGLAPEKGDRVVEIAVARVDASGRILDEYATLLNPEGRDVGPVFIHGIDNDAVRGAPRFQEILGDVLARFEGAIVVAHNARFEERFLAAELQRAEVRLPRLPALCTLDVARATLQAPNYRLATLARELGIDFPDAHSALGDVRTVAALLPSLLDKLHGWTPACPPFILSPELPRPAGVPARTRAANLRRGPSGWMVSLMSRLPMTAMEANDAVGAAYIEALSNALADGRITREEAVALADLVGRAGLGRTQVAMLNEVFLEGMRDAAFDDGILTREEHGALVRAAKALGVPDYFDDLVVTKAAPMPAASPRPTEPTQTKMKAPRRCGHCRQPGHYRTTCPDLVGVGPSVL